MYPRQHIVHTHVYTRTYRRAARKDKQSTDRSPDSAHLQLIEEAGLDALALAHRCLQLHLHVRQTHLRLTHFFLDGVAIFSNVTRPSSDVIPEDRETGSNVIQFDDLKFGAEVGLPANGLGLTNQIAANIVQEIAHEIDAERDLLLDVDI